MINERTNWQQVVQTFLSKGQYDQLTGFCEQAIEIEPNNIAYYIYLGLAYLLQGQEQEAQAIWTLAMAYDTSEEMKQAIEELLQILELEAQRQEDIANLRMSWAIRQYIREIAPNLINNLLHLLLLSIKLGNFTPNFFRDWQLIELLLQNSLNIVDAPLLSKALASIAELYISLEQEYLKALEYLHNSYADTEHDQSAIALRNQFVRPYKLHVGCGEVKFDGWINIDVNEKLNSVDILYDVSKGLPFDDGSCSMVYHEHLLEHLSIEKGVFFLQECHRVLQPEGILRVAMPSLDVLLEKANTENWQEQDWLTWSEYQFIQTRAEMINIAFRWWGHQWLYDRKELHRRLHEAGFMKVVDVEWGYSEIEELKNRETRKDSLLICEAWK